MRWRSALGVVVTGLALACAGREQDVPKESAQPRRHVRLAALPFLSSAPLFIALDEGYFDDEGLNVESAPVRPHETIAAMARGDVDVAAQFVTAGIFSAMAKGVPLRIVADKGRPTREGCGADGLLASNSVASRPRVPESLRGARIGYTEASVAEYVLEGFLEKGGLKRDDFEFIYVQTQNAGPALASGAIDFRLISEPAISNVVRRRQGKLWLKLADMQPEVQWACVVFGKSLLDDRETGLRFLRAYLRGVRRYNEGKTPSNVASVVRHTGLSADDVRASCWTQIRNDGQIDLPALMSFQRWGHRRGYLDQVLDPSKFYDPWFLERQTNRSAAP